MTLKIIQSIKIKRTIEGGDENHPNAIDIKFFMLKKGLYQVVNEKELERGALISGSFSLSLSQKLTELNFKFL